MKKFLVLVAILMLCIPLAAACSSGTSPTTAPSVSQPAATTPAKTTAPAPVTSAAVIPSEAPKTTSAQTTAASATAAPASGPRKGGILRWVKATGPGAPFGTPWLSSGASAFELQFAAQTLLKELVDGTLTPNLAESYEVVTDPANPSITFKLVKGVKFQDGTDFNAQAVKWNFEMAMSPSSTTRGSTGNWKSIEVLDDYTIKVNFKSWQNTQVRGFAESATYLVSPAIFKAKGEEWMMWNSLGTGAFVQKEFLRDVSLTFTRNSSFWRQGKPNLDGLQLLFVSDPMTATALFKSGGAEMIQTATAQMSSELQAAGFQILKHPGAMGSALVPDSANADSPWSKLKVRQAVEYALDRASLAKTFGYGFQDAAYQYYTAPSPAYDPSLAPRKYDVAKAKQLLTEAGYPNGFKTAIIVSALNVDRNMAAAIQANFAAVGIQAELQFPQTAAWSAYLTGSWKNAVLFGPVLGTGDPNAGWGLAYTTGSAWYQSLKRPDGWADLYKASISSPKLDPALVKKCEALFYEDVTTIPITWGSKEWAVSDKVRDSGAGTRGTYTWWEPENAWLYP
jgi:peptide/nickel transport system substrate-binding protein